MYNTVASIIFYTHYLGSDPVKCSVRKHTALVSTSSVKKRSLHLKYWIRLHSTLLHINTMVFFRSLFVRMLPFSHNTYIHINGTWEIKNILYYLKSIVIMYLSPISTRRYGAEEKKKCEKMSWNIDREKITNIHFQKVHTNTFFSVHRNESDELG